MKKRNMTEFSIKDIFFFIALIVIWQAVAYFGSDVFGWWKSYAFPTPAGVVASLVSMAKKGTLLAAVGFSMKRAVIGFAIALAAGAVMGVLITYVKYLNRNLKPLLMGIQTLPSICWVPFAILWFGLAEKAIIFVVVMGSVFSVSLAIENSIRNIPVIYTKVAKTMGAGRKDILLRVVLPAARPGFVSGLRQSWSFAWRALMSGEVMSSFVGLGYVLMLGRDLADINQVMAVMIVIIIVGIIIDKFVFSIAENRMLKKRGLE